MQQKVNQICYCFWLHGENFNCSFCNKRCRFCCFSCNVVGAPAGMISAEFNIVFSLATRIRKIILSKTRNKKKKHDKILAFTEIKLNSIKTLVSQVLIVMEISHEYSITIFYQKYKYGKFKNILSNVSVKLEETHKKNKIRQYKFKDKFNK